MARYKIVDRSPRFLPPPPGAPGRSTAQIDADVTKAMGELLARERAGTLDGPARRVLGERLDALLEEDKKAFRRSVGQAVPLDLLQSPFLEPSEMIGAWVIALTWLSPAITATILMLVEIIVPRDEGLTPLIVFALFQAGFLYAALFENHPRRGGITQSAEIESRKRKIEARFMEIERRRRRLVWYCAALVLPVFALTFVIVR